MPDQPVLTVIDAHESSRESLMAHVAGELRAKALVGESFLPALLDREAKFPTGVDFGGFRIAIPHIDPEHVRTRASSCAATTAPWDSRRWTIRPARWMSG